MHRTCAAVFSIVVPELVGYALTPARVFERAIVRPGCAALIHARTRGPNRDLKIGFLHGRPIQKCGDHGQNGIIPSCRTNSTSLDRIDRR